MIVYLNGAWLEAKTAGLPIDDRGFLLADGVFETARLVDGRYFRLNQHLDRLADSAFALRLTTPDHEELSAIALELAARNRLTEGSLRITITRGRGGRGLDTRGAGPQTLLVTLAPIAQDWRARAARGWHLIISTTRRPSPVSVPSHIKALGRVYALLAHLEAEAAGVDDALLLSADGDIAEGPTWNFFWRKADVIRTASLDAGVLEGVTRGIILQLAREAGYRTEEGFWTAADLVDADEGFASLTSVGVVPIRSIDGRALPTDDGAALLQRKYWEHVGLER
ncbi:MAG: aminotransferase class IV [Gemmatimonadota bacterium]